MDIVISPSKLGGVMRAIPSKSQAHRLLICAAFSDHATRIICPETNKDIAATVNCLNALGADISRDRAGYLVKPISALPDKAELPCCESGSTLRFLLPIAGALGVDTTFCLEGRLPQRPLSPLWEEMIRMGCRLSRPTENTVRCTGQLHSGEYYIAGNVSSQYITGLLFAAAMIKGDSKINILGKLESAPYVKLTQDALEVFGVKAEDYRVSYSVPFRSPREVYVEGDWSNAAFFLAAKYLGNDITLEGLSPSSAQGDRAVADLLPLLRQNHVVSGADIPDLIPILAVYAAANSGATFTDVERLRLKESERIATVAAMLNSLGGKTEITQNTLTVYPAKFQCGQIDPCNDHRIAMAGAIAATVATGPVIILGAECVQKSYPAFWDEFRRLGGQYEQYIR